MLGTAANASSTGATEGVGACSASARTLHGLPPLASHSIAESGTFSSEPSSSLMATISFGVFSAVTLPGPFGVSTIDPHFGARCLKSL
ncbi:hypothetical protein emb_1d0587 [Coriobacteriaceae bacterium EMTCatB1]|nr:hypothetical protein emb_1d0587 [Coriobacteriaceae bacterium EMTCatB1]